MAKITSIKTAQQHYHGKKVAPQPQHGPAHKSDYERRQATRGVHGVRDTHGAHNTRSGYPTRTPMSQPVKKGSDTQTFPGTVADYQKGKNLGGGK